MDSDMWLWFILLVFLVILGGYFASSEIAFASVNRFKVKIEAERGNLKAIRAMHIIDNFEDTLTTLLIGNNVTHIFAASIATLITTRLWGQWAVIYSTFIMTIIVFLISETLPKVIAKSYSFKFSLALSESLYALLKLMTPINFVLTKISDFFVGLLHHKASLNLSKQELHSIIDNMACDSELNKNRELLKFALNFGDTKASEVLTIRPDVIALDLSLPNDRIVELIKQTNHSRLPVYRENIDDIVGVLQIRKYIKSYQKNKATAFVEKLMDKPFFVHDGLPIDDIFRKMSVAKVNMAIVTNNFGGTQGIITVEDILEQLVGDIWDEDDIVVDEIKKIGVGIYEVVGKMEVLDLFKALDYTCEHSVEFMHKSMAMWTYESLTEVPKVGDSFEYDIFKVTVENVVNRRIKKITVTVLDDSSKGDDHDDN